MHQVADRTPIVSLVEFGCDRDHLYIRVDGTQPMRGYLESGIELRITFLKPGGMQVRLRQGSRPGSGGDDALAVHFEERLAQGAWQPRDCDGLAAAAREIVELRVPFRGLGAKGLTAVAFLLAVNRDGAEMEQHPRHGPIEIEMPDTGWAAKNWTA
jgi:hypothetical protein